MILLLNFTQDAHKWFVIADVANKGTEYWKCREGLKGKSYKVSSRLHQILVLSFSDTHDIFLLNWIFFLESACTSSLSITILFRIYLQIKCVFFSMRSVEAHQSSTFCREMKWPLDKSFQIFENFSLKRLLHIFVRYPNSFVSYRQWRFHYNLSICRNASLFSSRFGLWN